MKKSFLNDLLRVGTSNMLSIIVGLCTSIITARYLGPENNGLITGLTIFPSIFMSVGSLGIRQSTTFFLGKGIYEEGKIKTAIAQIWALTSIISIIICFILIYYFSRSGQNLLWVLLAIIPIPFSLFNTYNSGIYLGKNEIGAFNKINWIPTFIVFIVTTLFLIVLKMDVTGYMIALISGPVLMFILLLFKNKFIQSLSFSFDFKIIKVMLSLGAVYAVSLLVITLNYRVDVIILDKLSTPYQLGIYSKGVVITQYLWQIPMVMSTIVFARSAISKNGIEFSYKISQLLRLSLLAIGLISIVLFVLSDFIITTMYGQEFCGSINVLKILLPGVVILTLFKVMNMDLAGKGKPWISMKAMIPGLIINIILNIILIPKYGANGASFSSTISYGIAGILFIYFYSLETSIPIKEIITYKKTDFDPIKNIIKKIYKKR